MNILFLPNLTVSIPFRLDHFRLAPLASLPLLISDLPEHPLIDHAAQLILIFLDVPDYLKLQIYQGLHFESDDPTLIVHPQYLPENY